MAQLAILRKGCLCWYTDEPELMWKGMSWIERHLVDVNAIYRALFVERGRPAHEAHIEPCLVRGHATTP